MKKIIDVKTNNFFIAYFGYIFTYRETIAKLVEEINFFFKRNISYTFIIKFYDFLPRTTYCFPGLKIL